MKDNRTSVKHSLVTSAVALVLTAALLIGTTFAWFTSTAQAGVNKIESGTLAVKIVDATDETTEISNLDWQKAAGHKDEAVLWEPGATYSLQTFKIKNTGNLALKCKMNVSGATGDTQLLDVLNFTYTVGADTYTLGEELHIAAGATSDEITVTAKMDTGAGNDYRGLSITGITIDVVATQDTVEYDSNSNTYDANAVYPQLLTASTTAEVNQALATVSSSSANTNQNVTINVTSNLNQTTGIQTAATNTLTLKLNTNTVTVGGSVGSSATETNGAQLLKGSTVVMEGGTFKFDDNNQFKKILIQNYSNLTVKDINLDASNVPYALSTNCGNVTISGSTNITVKAGGTALDVMHWENASYKEEGSHVVIDETMTGTIDGKIDVYCYRNGSVVNPVDDGGATLVIKGGTFKNSGLTFEQFKAYVPDGYNATNNNGTYTVTKAN